MDVGVAVALPENDHFKFVFAFHKSPEKQRAQLERLVRQVLLPLEVATDITAPRLDSFSSDRSHPVTKPNRSNRSYVIETSYRQ